MLNARNLAAFIAITILLGGAAKANADPTGLLLVKGSPKGASVYVNGSPISPVLPWTDPIVLKAGQYKVWLDQMPGYKVMQAMTVEVLQGQVTEVELALEPEGAPPPAAAAPWPPPPAAAPPDTPPAAAPPDPPPAAAPPDPGLIDGDGDGVPDSMDECDGEKENVNGVLDEDGCLDGCTVKNAGESEYEDKDCDRIPDYIDRCPEKREDHDRFMDGDGCPELDNDEDGIPDEKDKCRREAEDKDGFQDEDGCPELDNDEDGIPDTNDRCPLEREDVDGVEDDDGCPDLPPPGRAVICQRRDLRGEELSTVAPMDKVQFEYASAELQPGSVPAVLGVKEELSNHPNMKVRVEGHTCDKGSDDYNLNLSEQRAQTVYDTLIELGVSPDRLDHKGYGEARPVVENKDEEHRVLNRRVEFVITEGAPADIRKCEEFDIRWHTIAAEKVDRTCSVAKLGDGTLTVVCPDLTGGGPPKVISWKPCADCGSGGAGIESARVNGRGQLVLVLKGGRKIVVGQVVGAEGPQGPAGKDAFADLALELDIMGMASVSLPAGATFGIMHELLFKWKEYGALVGVGVGVGIMDEGEASVGWNFMLGGLKRLVHEDGTDWWLGVGIDLAGDAGEFRGQRYLAMGAGVINRLILLNQFSLLLFLGGNRIELPGDDYWSFQGLLGAGWRPLGD